MEWRHLTLRPATPEDEQFLFTLRRATMDEHPHRAGMAIKHIFAAGGRSQRPRDAEYFERQ